MKIKVLSLIFSLMYIPLTFYLLYLELQRMQATELMWFLYWMLFPMAIVSGILTKVAEWEDD